MKLKRSPMSKILSILCLVLCCTSFSGASDMLSSLRQRRSDIDALLLKQKAVEGADGFVKANKDATKNLNQRELDLLVEENKDRKVLFSKMAERDSAIKDFNEAGKKFALKYIESYKKGVLRENPANQLVYHHWPPEVESAGGLISEFFETLDSRELELKQSVETN